MDRLLISQIRESCPKIIDLVLGERSGTATLVWEGAPGSVYAVEFSNDLVGETWRMAGNVVGDGSIMSWVDDGFSTGCLPGDDLVGQRYYRVMKEGEWWDAQQEGPE